MASMMWPRRCRSKPDRIHVAGEDGAKASPWACCPTPAGAIPTASWAWIFLSRYFVVLDRAAMRLKLLPPGDGCARALCRLDAEWS